LLIKWSFSSNSSYEYNACDYLWRLDGQ
jgi:hypothetical protein